MMTTERTAIRRRLAIRRTAHRPPWSGRKAGHGSIVAPLAATLAATVAVGLGVALARAERDRRTARGRRLHDRRFALLGGERLGGGLRRMALGQLDVAIELLEGRGGPTSPERAVHDTRKALKRLRALVRLLEDELGEQAFKRENALLRDAGVRLRQARDAEVMLSTLDGLLKRHPKKLGSRRGRAAAARASAERARRRRRAGAGRRRHASGRARRPARAARAGQRVGAGRPGRHRGGRTCAQAPLPQGPPAPAARGAGERRPRARAHAARMAQTRQGPALRRGNARPRR